MRVSAIIPVLVLPLFLASGSADPGSLAFDVPAQVGPAVEARGGTWVLLVFSGAAASGRLELAHSRGEEFLEKNLQPSFPGIATQTLYGPLASRELRFEPLRTTLAFGGGPGSLFIEARELTVAAMGASTTLDGKGPVCLHPFVHAGIQSERAGRYDQLCPPPAITGKLQEPRNEPFVVALEASGIHTIEWHNARLGCATAEGCPSGGTRSETVVEAPNGNVTVRDQTFERLSTAQGFLVLSGEATFAMFGAPSMDVDIHGAGRFPKASCGSCRAEEGQTLQLEGNFTLADLELRNDGTASARLQGQVTRGRFDERTFDPASLLGYGAAAATATVAAAVLAKALAGFLFTRLRHEEDLRNANRRRIYEYVTSKPGATLREIGRQTQLAPGQARHHIRVLKGSGRLTEVRHGRTRRFFPVGEEGPESRLRTILLREQNLAALYDLICRQPGLAQSDLIHLLQREHGWRRSTIQHRLRRLRQAGLVEVQGEGRHLAVEQGARPGLDRTASARPMTFPAAGGGLRPEPVGSIK